MQKELLTELEDLRDETEFILNNVDIVENKHIENYLRSLERIRYNIFNKIKLKEKYDYIIIDDVLPNSSALAVLEELKKVKDFKTPIIVMLNDNKEGIKLHYLKDGFADYIIKSKLDTELARIMKRF